MKRRFEEYAKVVTAIPVSSTVDEQKKRHYALLDELVQAMPSLKNGPVPFKDAMVAALATRGGLLIGEYHFDPRPRLLLAEHMDTLEKAGVTDLFLELTRENQDILDEFTATSGMQSDKDRLSSRLRTEVGSEHSPESLAELIAAAHRKGISVHAMDTPLFQEEDNWRVAGSNPFMSGTIQQTMASRPNGKFLALVGGDHTNIINGVNSPGDYPTIDVRYRPPNGAESTASGIQSGELRVIAPVWQGLDAVPVEESKYSDWLDRYDNSTLVLELPFEPARTRR